ncbi:hypothetical protein G6O67_004159 [Ophiocordyceps sinensis]|uniref:Uncharacterized protein n=1 Tax=Ophiocordyceps sinensis TaxID=72228 RepID=A0A8H4PNU5_9HYPO|nr:hypothetical protein G6O67_004159 [Ophiocordyceps sinensis]
MISSWMRRGQQASCRQRRNAVDARSQVPEPVGRRGQTHAGAPVSRRVELCVDGPHEGTPANSKRGNGETGKGHEGRAGPGRLHRVDTVQGKVPDKGVDAWAKSVFRLLDGIATYRKHTIIQAAPAMSVTRRLKRLMIHRPAMVHTTLTEPRMSCVV